MGHQEKNKKNKNKEKQLISLSLRCTKLLQLLYQLKEVQTLKQNIDIIFKFFILKCIQDVLMGGIYIKIYIWKWAVLE